MGMTIRPLQRHDRDAVQAILMACDAFSAVEVDVALEVLDAGFAGEYWLFGAEVGGILRALPFAKANRLRPLAASTTKRSAMMPELPTISESGLKGFDSATTFAAFTPAGTPRDEIGRAHV